MTEIKPRMVDGEAVCSEECPQLLGNAEYCNELRGRLIPDELSVCWPYYRAKVAELEREVERLRQESDAAWDSAEHNARRAEAAEAERGRLATENEQIKSWADATIEEQGRRLDRLAAVVRDLLDYEETGAPDHPDWDTKFDALRAALTATTAPAKCETSTEDNDD